MPEVKRKIAITIGTEGLIIKDAETKNIIHLKTKEEIVRLRDFLNKTKLA